MDLFVNAVSSLDILMSWVFCPSQDICILAIYVNYVDLFAINKWALSF